MADRETNLAVGAETELSVGLASGATTINVDDTSAFPAVPFFITIDATSDSKREVILVDDSTTATTMVLTAASSRGQDGTSDVSHDAGAAVRLEPVPSHWDDMHDRLDNHEGAFDGDHGADHDARDHTTAAGTVSLADLGTKDHDLLAGLGDDDHTQYLLADGTRQASYVDLSGLTGATAASRYVGATTSGAPASGTFAKGDFVIDQSGSVWVCTAAGSPGTWAEVAGGSASSLLAVVSHQRTSNTTTTSTSFVDVDASNLTVTFTAPTSGQVIVRLEARADVDDTAGMAFNLRDAGGDVSGTGRVAITGDASASPRLSTAILVTGLTGGNSYTYKWGWKVYGGTGTFRGASSEEYAIMEVWAA